MDHETLQALVGVYRARGSADLLSIILDEAEGPNSQALALELLRPLPADAFSDRKFAAVRRKACQFSLDRGEFALAERFARASELPEDKAMLARSLHGLGREAEALALYSRAIAEDPALRNKEMENLLGIRAAGTGMPAKVISLTTYSKRDGKAGGDRRDGPSDAYPDDFDDPAFTFSDVAGLEEAKAEIRRRIILPYLKPSLFERFKQAPGGNILLYGPPGCGKTLLARAAAGETDARFLSVSPDDILDKYAGEAEKRLRAYFEEARSDTPAILFFDDFDALGFQARRNAGDMAAVLVRIFLSELDSNLHNNRGLLVICAANEPWLLDPSLFQPGYFQRAVYVAAPDPQARRKILETALDGVPRHEKFDMDRIVRKTAGFSGAGLRALADRSCQIAMTRALSGAVDIVLTTSLFCDGLAHFAPEAERWLRVAKAELRYLQLRDHVPPPFFDLLRA